MNNIRKGILSIPEKKIQQIRIGYIADADATRHTLAEQHGVSPAVVDLVLENFLSPSAAWKVIMEGDINMARLIYTFAIVGKMSLTEIYQNGVRYSIGLQTLKHYYKQLLILTREIN